jgi:hypothetical protein
MTKSNAAVPALSTAALSSSIAASSLSRDSLRAQAAAFVALAARHSKALSQFDWTAKDTASLQASLLQFDHVAAEASAKRQSAKAATAHTKALLAEGVAVRERLVATLRMIAVKNPAALSVADLKAGKASRTAVALSGWFNDVKPAVRAVRDDLERILRVDPIHLVEKQAEALLDAAGAQGGSKRALSESTAALREARRALAFEIGRLCLAAKAAFAGSPEVKRQFRKKVRKAKAAVGVTPPKMEAANEQALAEPAAA